jgi:hypothetical protein
MTESLTPEAQRDLAAMNARVYAMTAEDRDAWYRDHKLSHFFNPPRNVEWYAVIDGRESLVEWWSDSRSVVRCQWNRARPPKKVDDRAPVEGGRTWPTAEAFEAEYTARWQLERAY